MFEKYYIYKRDEYFDNIAYDDFLDAVDVAMENNCDEIEVHQWECEEDYIPSPEALVYKVVFK